MISIAAEIAEEDFHDENSLSEKCAAYFEHGDRRRMAISTTVAKKRLYPLAFVKENKFWPSVRRVDEAFGDRNLICSCPSVESYSS